MKVSAFILLLAICSFARAQGYKMEGNQLITDQKVIFAAGSAELSAESDAALQSVKAFLEAKTYITLLRIEGHLAPGGVESSLQTLSEKRAMAVVKWLVAHGIDCKRLLPVGFGTTKPMVANDGPERSANNRIEFRMAAMRDKAIGGMPVDGGGKTAGDPCE
jgi:OmpA-OmpF porin, OOP family